MKKIKSTADYHFDLNDIQDFIAHHLPDVPKNAKITVKPKMDYYHDADVFIGLEVNVQIDGE